MSDGRGAAPSWAPRPTPIVGPGSWIALQARNQPAARCLVESTGRIWSFAEVNGRVNRVAHLLSSSGVGRGSRVGLLATDSVDYVVVVLACHKLGATYVPFNYRLSPGELTNLARFADLEAFLTIDRYRETTAGVVAGCPSLRLVASLDDAADLPTLDTLLEDVHDEREVVATIDPEDIAALMFTSGTTGFPKGVLQSFRMIKANTTAGIVDLRLLPDELRYTASPMFHVAGIGCIFYGIARGFASLVMPQYDAAEVVRWLRRGLTGLLLMPTMLYELLGDPDVRTSTFPALRSIFYGGAPIPPPVLREALEVFDCAFFNTFGAGTEAGGQTVLGPEEHLRALAGEPRLLGSIGKPMYGVELRLCDEALVDVPRGEIGEIVTRSETICSGYLDDAERSAATIVDGWYRGGDLAWMDDEGYLFLAGRANDMIIRGGENVYPLEIESVVVEHEAVTEVAVVGLPDDRWGQIVAAAVIVEPGSVFDADQLRSFCRTRLAAYKVPERVYVVDELPKNANGKVQKHAVVTRLADLEGR